MVAMHTDGKYEVLPSTLKQHAGTYYRVRNTETGDESMLYTWTQCLEIIEHAKAGELKGSFDL